MDQFRKLINFKRNIFELGLISEFTTASGPTFYSVHDNLMDKKTQRFSYLLPMKENDVGWSFLFRWESDICHIIFIFYLFFIIFVRCSEKHFCLILKRYNLIFLCQEISFQNKKSSCNFSKELEINSLTDMAHRQISLSHKPTWEFHKALLSKPIDTSFYGVGLGQF